MCVSNHKIANCACQSNLKKKKKRNGTGKRWVSFPDTIQRDLRMLKKRLPNPCIGISDMIMETS